MKPEEFVKHYSEVYDIYEKQLRADLILVIETMMLTNKEKQQNAEMCADNADKPGSSDYWKGVYRGYVRGVDDLRNYILAQLKTK